jgi:hypothetical protein
MFMITNVQKEACKAVMALALDMVLKKVCGANMNIPKSVRTSFQGKKMK